MATTFLQVANRATSTTAGAINNSSDPVTFSVASGQGSLFPSSFPFHITIDNEILSVTARSTDSLTASRAQQGTSIASHTSGAIVELRVTAKNVSDLNTAVNAVENKFPVASADITDGTIVNADVNASAAIAKTKLASLDVVNADVNSSAAIAYSKLNLGTSIVNADVSTSAAIAYSKLNLGTSIVNADVSTSAAIAYSKLNLTGAVLNADLAGSIAYSKLSLTGSIVGGDISTAADTQMNSLGLGIAPASASARLIVGAAAGTTAAEGIQFGTTSPPQLFRVANNTLELSGAAVQSFGINTSTTVSALTMSSTTLYTFFGRQGSLELGKSTNAVCFRTFFGTTADTQPYFSITSKGDMAWGPGGSTAVDNSLTRTGTTVMSFSQNVTIVGGTLLLTDVSLVRTSSTLMSCSQGFGATAFSASGLASAGFYEGFEQSSDPSAPAANGGRLFFKDNGSGKTQLAVRFNTGATQIIATEP